MGNKNVIGLRISKLREKKGLSQKQLSDELKKIGLEVRRETITQWENGSRDLKTEYTVKLADFFGVTCDYILRGIESENVDISKETGLTNDSIEHLKKLGGIKWGQGDIAVPNTINSFIGSGFFVNFLLAFWDYQLEIERLVESEKTFMQSLSGYGEQIPSGMTLLEYAARLSLENESCMKRGACSVIKQADSVNYKLFKLDQSLKRITDEYRKGREDG